MPTQQNSQSQYGQQVQPQFTWEGGHLVMYHKEATGLPQVKDATVNDRDRMQDLLAMEKYLTDSYCKAMNEASHDALLQLFRQNFDDCQQVQRQVFNTMFKKGWYKLPVADAQSVTHAYTQFQQYRTQFPDQSQQLGGVSAGGSVPEQQLNQTVSQAIRQAEEGQVPSVNVSAGAARGSNTQATVAARSATTAGSSQTEQQLSQKVDQALKEVERGQVPGGYSAPTRSHH